MKARTLEEYIDASKKYHGNKYQYLYLLTENGFRRIYLICPIHGKFDQLADSHLNGAGCKKCYNDKKKNQQTESFENFVIKANKVFGNKYEYIHLIAKNKNNYRQINYRCKYHGEIVQNADNHLKGWGCNQCGYERVSEKLSDTFDTTIQKANLTHKNKYQYVRLYKENGDRFLEIICPKHGIFKQIASNHIKGYGCPDCSFTNISKMENSWLDSIGILKENRSITLPFLGRLRVDGYDPSTNTIYEFYGDFWHGNPKIYQLFDKNSRNGKTFKELFDSTIIRENKIKKYYNLITIWESDWTKNMENKYDSSV
jgi:hypothetical protein